MRTENEDFDPLDEKIDLTNATWSLPGETAHDTLLRAANSRTLVPNAVPRLTTAKPIPGHTPTTYDIDDPDFDPLDFEVDMSNAVQGLPGESLKDLLARARHKAEDDDDSKPNPVAG